MNQFESRGISCVPVVDGSGKLVDIYCKYDLIHLVSSSTYSHLDLTIREALTVRQHHFEGVLTCRGRSEVKSALSNLASLC